MRNYMVLSLLSFMFIIGCSDKREEKINNPPDIFASTMKNKIGFYPLLFEETNNGCRCIYAIKNTFDADLNRFRGWVRVHNNEHQFDCDIGVMISPIQPGEISARSNIAFGKQCGTIKFVEFIGKTDCTLSDNRECEDSELETLPYDGVSWREFGDNTGSEVNDNTPTDSSDF